VGWASLRSPPPPAPDPVLTVAGVDATFSEIGAVSGKGAQARRAELVAGLFAAATETEQTFLLRLLGGELRQGALAGIMADAVAKEIDAVCQRTMEACPGATVEWQPVNGFRLATRVERTEPLVRAMIKGVRQATGRSPTFGGVPGSTDGTILRMALGIPIVTCGPGHRLIPHQVDEYVEVAQLVEAARIYVASALNFLEP